LDGIYRDELTAWRTLFETRQGRASTDTAQAARAATVGAVDSMLMDIDETLLGRIAEDGAVVFAEHPTTTNYDVADEIATRAITTGGRVFGVRKAEIPQAAALAAILRYPANSPTLSINTRRTAASRRKRTFRVPKAASTEFRCGKGFR